MEPASRADQGRAGQPPCRLRHACIHHGVQAGTRGYLPAHVLCIPCRLASLDRGRTDLAAWLGLGERVAAWDEIHAAARAKHAGAWDR